MTVADLGVYKRLFTLALQVHNHTMQYPKFEMYELGSQTRRSSNSCPANLAEGFGNKHTNIFTETISRAQGEIRETIHHLKMAHEKQYINQDQLYKMVDEYQQCSKMLYGLEKSLILNPKS
jgi:four helix bundle protein